MSTTIIPETTEVNDIIRGYSNFVFNLAAPGNDRIWHADLCAKALPDCHELVEFKVAKGWLNPGAKKVHYITGDSDENISKNPAKGLVELTSFHPCGGYDLILYTGHMDITGLPGKKDITFTADDESGETLVDEVGFSDGPTPVLLIWRESTQKGAILSYDSGDFRIQLSLNPRYFSEFISPFGDPLDIEIPELNTDNDYDVISEKEIYDMVSKK